MSQHVWSLLNRFYWKCLVCDKESDHERISRPVPVEGCLDRVKIDKELVYVEDNQGYSYTNTLFKTNSYYSAGGLSRLSWKVYGAGRISVSFIRFREQVKSEGFSCELIERDTNSTYEQVIGAYGNY